MSYFYNKSLNCNPSIMLFPRHSQTVADGDGFRNFMIRLVKANSTIEAD